MAKRRSLVYQHLENVSGDALDEYQDIIRDYVHRQQGVYALYRRGKLYYVGLASNLRNRLKAHLKDRHAGRWDRFSLYLTEDVGHLKELESLVLRIVRPSGNKVIGGFAKSENLKRRFGQGVREQALRRADEVLGRPRKLSKARSRRRGIRRADDKPILAGHFPRAITLKGWYKGYEYTARLRRDGTIQYGGRVYRTPSDAAKAARRRPSNGWSFWHYKDRRGDWVRLRDLAR